MTMGVVGSIPELSAEHSLASGNNDTTVPVHQTDIGNECSNPKHSKSPSGATTSDETHQLNTSDGRCSKCKKNQKKAIRRYKNLEVINASYDALRDQLKTQIQDLETQQDNLISQVEKLYSHKQQLQLICEQLKSEEEDIME